MRRIIYSVLVLSLILLFCCWSLWQVQQICSDTKDFLYQAEQQVLTGDYENACLLIQGGRQHWGSHKGILGIMLRQTEADDVDLLFPIVAEACRQKDTAEYILQNQELIALLSNISRVEFPHYYHIL